MRQPDLVPIAARLRINPPVALAYVAGFLLPLKAARVDVGGLSLYAAYLAAGMVAVEYSAEMLSFFRQYFAMPLVVLTTFAGLGVARGAGLVGPAVTTMKLTVALITAAAFAVLLRRAERWLYLGLLAGVIFSVAYMVYQSISALFFGFGLPYTSIRQLKVGLGLSERYGLTRVTGFTEEPSFIATLIVGSTLLLIAYAYRSQRWAMLRVAAIVGGLGLALCTSNNLFATAIIIGLAWPLVRARRISAMLGIYYVAALAVTPVVLYRDITFYSRFSPYQIFLQSNPLEMLIGRGVGSYPAYFAANQIQFDGQDVASLASVWGGFLFEGGVVLVAIVIAWLARTIFRAGWREGLALLALLLMLSNYNSPWWPLVSLALAQCLVLERKDTSWITKSISPATATACVVGAHGSLSLRSSVPPSE